MVDMITVGEVQEYVDIGVVRVTGDMDTQGFLDTGKDRGTWIDVDVWWDREV